MPFDHHAAAAADARFFAAIGRFIANVLVFWPWALVKTLWRWLAVRRLRWAALWASFSRWLTLAVAKKDDGRLVEMAAHQRFLSASPLSPLRFFAWTGVAVAGIAALIASWAVFVRVPALERELASAADERDAATSRAQVAERDRNALAEQTRMAREAVETIEATARHEAQESQELAQRRDARRRRLAEEETRNARIREQARLNGEPLVDLDGRLRDLAGPASAPSPAVSSVPAGAPGADPAGGVPGEPGAPGPVPGAGDAPADRG